MIQKIKAVFTDVDGTLTDKHLKLSIEAVTAIRELERHGVIVNFVSSHAYPVVSTLATYIGISGFAISESGAVIAKRFNVIRLYKPSYSREDVVEVLESLGFRRMKLELRLVDLSFRRTGTNVSAEEIKKALAERGINVEVYDSGFAVHIVPAGVSKAKAVEEVIRLLGLKEDEIIVIGDGDNDIPMLERFLSAVPSDATERAKRAAKIKLNLPDGLGFAELAMRILEEKGKDASALRELITARLRERSKLITEPLGRVL